jgi:hypothetical protein
MPAVTHDLAKQDRPHKEIHCSFCAKSQVDVQRMIGGPGVHICDECVALCVKVIEDTRDVTVTPQTAFQDYWPTPQLLTNLKLYDGAFEAVDRSMQDIVDILREREISWAQIGEALGVSRQAAWKRFG